MPGNSTSNHITGQTTCFIYQISASVSKSKPKLDLPYWQSSPGFVFACGPVQSSIPGWPWWTRWRPHGVMTLRRTTTTWKCKFWNTRFKKNLLIDLKERERNMDWGSTYVMHSLVDPARAPAEHGTHNPRAPGDTPTYCVAPPGRNACLLKNQLHKGHGLCWSETISRKPRCSIWGHTDPHPPASLLFPGFGCGGLFLRWHSHDTSVYWSRTPRAHPRSVPPGPLGTVPIAECVFTFTTNARLLINGRSEWRSSCCFSHCFTGSGSLH